MSIRDDLKAYVDGELSLDRAQEVRSAIEADPALQQEVQFMKQLSKGIAGLSPQPKVEGAEETLKLIARSRRPWWALTKRKLAFASGAACLLLAFFVIGNLSMNKADESSATPSAKDSTDAKLLPKQSRSSGELGDFNAQERRSMAGAEAAPSSTAKAPAEHKLLDQPGGGRRVIQSADLAVVVTKPASALTSALDAAKANGGYAQSSALEKDGDGEPVATVTLRVPVDHFATVTKELKELGTVTRDHVSGDDVTVQIADTEGRIQALEAQSASYVEMLKSARKVQDSLDIRDRLDQVQQELQSIRNQASTLRDMSAMSTIKATFTTKAKEVHAAVVKPQSWLDDAWSTALAGFISACKVIAQMGIYILVYSPLWCPIVALIWWSNRRWGTSYADRR